MDRKASLSPSGRGRDSGCMPARAKDTPKRAKDRSDREGRASTRVCASPRGRTSAEVRTYGKGPAPKQGRISGQGRISAGQTPRELEDDLRERMAALQEIIYEVALLLGGC